MFAEVRTFNDPQQHAGSILGWQQVYDQLGRGCLSSELRQVCADRFQIFQEVLDKRVVQRGCAPRGRLCIAMSLGGAPVVQGTKWAPTASCCCAMAKTSSCTRRKARTSSRPMSTRSGSPNWRPTNCRANSSSACKACPRSAWTRRCCAACSKGSTHCFVTFGTGRRRQSRLGKILEDVLLNAFLDLFSHASDEVRGRRGNFAVSAYLVKRCQELVVSSADVPLSILDLCEQLRVSRRTLQNSFQAVTGMRPVEYLRNLRLNAVRRRLITTHAAALNVSEIAMAMGFFHLSHFAAHYRALFGESPSDTPRAPA